jgi:hypothetical protein
MIYKTNCTIVPKSLFSVKTVTPLNVLIIFVYADNILYMIKLAAFVCLTGI